MRSVVYTSVLILALGVTCVHAQTNTDTNEKITIVLADGPLVVDEVTEETDGYWYKRGNMSKFLDRDASFASNARNLRPENPLRKRSLKARASGNYPTPAKSKSSSSQSLRSHFRCVRSANPICTLAGVGTIATEWTLVFIPTVARAAR